MQSQSKFPKIHLETYLKKTPKEKVIYCWKNGTLKALLILQIPALIFFVIANPRNLTMTAMVLLSVLIGEILTVDLILQNLSLTLETQGTMMESKLEIEQLPERHINHELEEQEVSEKREEKDEWL